MRDFRKKKMHRWIVKIFTQNSKKLIILLKLFKLRRVGDTVSAMFNCLSMY